VNKNEKLGFSIIQNLNFEYTSTLDIYLIRILLFIINLTQIITLKNSPLFPTFPNLNPHPATQFNQAKNT